MGVERYLTSEADLVRGCRQRNPQAQKGLYNRYGSKLYGVCCRYIKDRMQAEDVWITAFTKILDRMDQFSGEGSLEGWMRKVVVNESLSYLRKSRHLYLETDLETADAEGDYGLLPDSMEAADLMQLIQELPDGYRIVFNLFAIEGYTHQEIAARLQISENTSKSQLSRARAVLQKKIIERESHRPAKHVVL